VSLSVSSPGQGNLYQWFRNGVLVSGATSSQLPIADLIFDNMGDYYCEVPYPLASS